MSNVIEFPGSPPTSVPVDKMLENIAKDKGVSRAVVLVEMMDGTTAFYTSDSDAAWTYLMAGRFMHKMAGGDFETR